MPKLKNIYYIVKNYNFIEDLLRLYDKDREKGYKKYFNHWVGEKGLSFVMRRPNKILPKTYKNLVKVLGEEKVKQFIDGPYFGDEMDK